MVISVLDASGILRFLLGEADDERVLAILTDAQNGVGRALISSVNWGEVVGRIYKLQNRAAAEALTPTFQFYGLEIVSASAGRAAKAALLKVDLKWDMPTLSAWN